MNVLKMLGLSAALTLVAGGANAAQFFRGEPPSGTLPAGKTAYYLSASCQKENPDKPFKVVKGGDGVRVTIGCFTETEAKKK